MILELQSLWQQLDSDQDGKISADELLVLTNEYRDEDSNIELEYVKLVTIDRSRFGLRM